MSRTLALALAVCVALAGAGCLKKESAPAADLEQAKADEILGKTGREALVEAAAIIPKNYTFPGQELLPPQLFEHVGQITTAANGALEAERDEGGIERGTFIEMQDISNLLPPGQPAELTIDLVWDASEANSADLDIAVDVPGMKTMYSSTSETFNWNLAVKTIVVNTIGVEGQPALVGVQAAGGVVSQGFEYTLRVQAEYVEDVLTPYHAWAFSVPSGASGLIFESEKAGGEDHVAAQFVILDPEDNLVQFVDYNDIDIPTESIYVATPKPGEYVFYAYSMHGGFLRVKTDTPMQENGVRQLALVETRVADSTTLAPGVAGKDHLNGSAASGTLPASDVSPTVVPFTTEGAFPLRVTGYITGPVTTQAKVTLKSPLGIVHTLTSIARVEDESGSVGYTSKHEGSPNNIFDWKNIQRGSWTAEIVNTSPAVEIGHVVLSYTR